MQCAALIPAYLEERHIRRVVGEARKHIERVLVVDDGSADATSSEARAGGGEVLRHERNQGKGAALRTGFRHLLDAGVEVIVILDGDGQHVPAEIARFVGTARHGTMLAVGNRMADPRGMPWLRLLTNRGMSALVSQVCGQRIPDSQCGFRMLRREVVELLLATAKTSAYEFETEMLLVASRQGYRIDAVPVTTVYADETSKIRPVRDTLAFLRMLRRFRREFPR